MTERDMANHIKVLLADLGQLHCGQSPSVADVNTNGDGVLYVTGPEQWVDGKVLQAKWTTAPKRYAPDNSIFIAVKGAGVGKMAFGVECAIGRDVYAFEPSELLDAKFMYWAIKEGVNEIVLKAQGDIPGLSKAHILEHQIILPPTNEQRRIVARIEAMFDEIDHGVENLKKAKATLGLYRQSLLKAAFEGRLTADWRAQNPDKLEDPETLLARIQKEREARYQTALEEWQKALADWRDGGEQGKKPAKPKRLQELSLSPDKVDERGWVSAPLGQMIGEVQQGWSPKCDGNEAISDDDWTVVKTTAVQHMKYYDTELKRLPDRFVPRPEIEIQEGDFLMTRKGPRARTGVVCLVRATRKRIMLCDTVYRFRCDEAVLKPDFLEIALNTPTTLAEIDALKSGISDSGISLNHGKIKSVGISFPLAKEEQAEIMRLLGERLSAADALEVEIDAGLTRAEALRQSILKQAFSGKLVPQDPNDEPASILLERIKAEKAKAPKAKRRRKATA